MDKTGASSKPTSFEREGRVRPTPAETAQRPNPPTTAPPSTTPIPASTITPSAGQQSVQSLSFNDSRVLAYLQGLDPNSFNLAEALQKMQENLGFPDPSSMTPDRTDEDDAASLPAARGADEDDARSGDTIVLGEDERECTEARFFDVEEELDQPMTEAGPVEKEVKGTTPLDLTTVHAPTEGAAEHVQSASQEELLAAGTPELFTTPSAGEHFGTDDFPLADDGVDFDFALPEGKTATTIPPTMEEEEKEIPLDQGEQQDTTLPQAEEGARQDDAPPSGREEGMGETDDIVPMIVNLDSEGEDEGLPPLRNQHLELAEGDDGSGRAGYSGRRKCTPSSS